jgi:hypothetical protein
MSQIIIEKLFRTQKRLDYYLKLKQHSGEHDIESIQKWIDIYTNRILELKAQCEKNGLRLDLDLDLDKVSESHPITA